MENRIKEIVEESKQLNAKLEVWIGPEALNDLESKRLSLSEYSKEYGLLRNEAIKKHVSSTHTWIKGKIHYLKKYDNWYQSPLECSVCKMHASNFEEVGWSEYVEITDLPSHDTHMHRIYRTCQEVLAAKEKHTKAHKGGKCYQCWTYGCLFKDI